jgi:hypothetical protein
MPCSKFCWGHAQRTVWHDLVVVFSPSVDDLPGSDLLCTQQRRDRSKCHLPVDLFPELGEEKLVNAPLRESAGLERSQLATLGGVDQTNEQANPVVLKRGSFR